MSCKQTSKFTIKGSTTSLFVERHEGKEDSLNLNDSKKVSIIFRNTIPEITSTTCGTFSIYKYPAKFIPQVIAFVIKKYAKSGMRIFDPFAGYGTTGLVSRVYGYDYELWDLNPMLEIIHKTAILSNSKFKLTDVIDLLAKIKNYQGEFFPNWSNLNYWFPEEFLSVISRAWGFVHTLEDEKKYLILIPLLKVTRYFSWSDEKVHKLYRSKYSKSKIEHLLKKDWESEFYEQLKKEVFTLINKIREYDKLNPKNVKYRIRAGINTLNTELNEKVDILITSPPYIQAQEYIRSTKLELFWLGYSEEYVKKLSKNEIPYTDVDKIEIKSSKYYEFREKIKENELKLLYDRYFHSILNVFMKLGEKVTSYMCIFVGPAKIRNVPIPIDDIIVEHLENFGWKHEITYIDRILSRVMFESKINPATKNKDSRIKTEHLVILKK